MKTTNETTVQHTPGPWHIGMKPGPMVYGPSGEQAADLRCGAMLPSDEARANLRLIAAAPELLAALEECITEDGAHCASGRELTQALFRRLSAINAVASAAIAKAKGNAS